MRQNVDDDRLLLKPWPNVIFEVLHIIVSGKEVCARDNK